MDLRFGLRIVAAHLLLDLALIGLFVWNGWRAAENERMHMMGRVEALWAQENVSFDFDPWVMDVPPLSFQLIQMGALPVAVVEAAVFPRAHWQTPGKLLHWPWAVCHLLLAGAFWWGLASFRTGSGGAWDLWLSRFPLLRFAGLSVVLSPEAARMVMLLCGLAWVGLGLVAGGYWLRHWLRLAARRMTTFWWGPGQPS